MDGIEAQERSGFKDLHGLLGRLPVPTVKASQAITHKDALEGGLLPSMTKESRNNLHHPNFSCTSMPWNTGTNWFDCSAYKACTTVQAHESIYIVHLVCTKYILGLIVFPQVDCS